VWANVRVSFLVCPFREKKKGRDVLTHGLGFPCLLSLFLVTTKAGDGNNLPRFLTTRKEGKTGPQSLSNNGKLFGSE
jgi:hypothetical protein